MNRVGEIELCRPHWEGGLVTRSRKVIQFGK